MTKSPSKHISYNYIKFLLSNHCLNEHCTQDYCKEELLTLKREKENKIMEQAEKIERVHENDLKVNDFVELQLWASGNFKTNIAKDLHRLWNDYITDFKEMECVL